MSAPASSGAVNAKTPPIGGVFAFRFADCRRFSLTAPVTQSPNCRLRLEPSGATPSHALLRLQEFARRLLSSSIAIVAQLPATTHSGAMTLTDCQCATGMPVRGFEDVAIAAAVEFEEALVVAAGRHGARREIEPGDRARRLGADARCRSRHGAPSACGPSTRTSPARLTQSVPDAMLDADRRGAVGRVFLADAAEVDFHAGARQADRMSVPLDRGPADERTQSRERGASGSRGGWRSKSHARRSTPDVMSKRPPLSAKQWSA